MATARVWLTHLEVMATIEKVRALKGADAAGIIHVLLRHMTPDDPADV